MNAPIISQPPSQPIFRRRRHRRVEVLTIPVELGGLRLDPGPGDGFSPAFAQSPAGLAQEAGSASMARAPMRAARCAAGSVEIDAPPPPEVTAELPEDIPLAVVPRGRWTCW